MTTNHYNEADLLETYYMTPDQASPLIAHVNECDECRQRYQRLARKLREMAACPAEKPSTFWTRQRLMIMRAVESARGRSHRTAHIARIAAAAVLVFALGGVTVYETVPKEPPAVVAQQTAAPVTASDDLQVPRDPWDSDELKDFGAVVQWQSWVTQSNSTAGGSSL
jgi:predicted anti-sigma-YlaC factor YlaD